MRPVEGCTVTDGFGCVRVHRDRRAESGDDEQRGDSGSPRPPTGNAAARTRGDRLDRNHKPLGRVRKRRRARPRHRSFGHLRVVGKHLVQSGHARAPMWRRRFPAPTRITEAISACVRSTTYRSAIACRSRSGSRRTASHSSGSICGSKVRPRAIDPRQALTLQRGPMPAPPEHVHPDAIHPAFRALHPRHSAPSLARPGKCLGGGVTGGIPVPAVHGEPHDHTRWTESA